MIIKRYKYVIFHTFALCLVILDINAQSYLEREDQWVREKISNMTLDQKVGQLFMVRAYSRDNQNEEKIINEYITKYHIGGICFFQGSPTTQARLINSYQQKASTPLFMGIDAEWGLGMRFPNSTISYPKQLFLGAISDNKLIYEMGKEIARQCKLTGININFAPSIDINSNPSNPVIYDRSFGESPQNVTEKGFMYMKALEDHGVMACIKHFPGHGDTDEDSHYDLPVVDKTREDLDKIEFFPFRRLSSQGVGAVMVGHLHIPALDSRSNRPSSLSYNTIKKVLRDDIGYNGLIFTDAMDMKGVTHYFPSGIAEAEAFMAGNDLILLPENLPKAVQTLKDYIQNGKISTSRLDESLERILRAKYKLGLNFIPFHPTDNIHELLNSNKALSIKQKLSEAAITIISDKENTIPIQEIDETKIATLSINVHQQTIFQNRAAQFTVTRNLHLMPNQIAQDYQQYLQTLAQFDKVIVGIHTSGKQNDFSKNLPDETLRFLKELNNKTEVIIVVFGSPYILKKLGFAKNLLINYDNDSITQDVTMQSIFGVSDITGKLPVSVNESWPVGHGEGRKSLKRLGYALPEMVGMSSDSLKKIDSIMNVMITTGAAPGGQVLIAKDGKIIHQKSYGKLAPDGYYVSDQTIYDVASLTKILSTTISTMKLVDQGKININQPLRQYISGIDTTDKAQIVIKDILAHHAKLFPWIGFYESTVAPSKSYGYNPKYYSGIIQSEYSVPVARGMFMRSDYKDSVYHQIYTSKLRESDSYRYSDLGFFMMQKVIENQSGTALDLYVENNFYKPLGLRHTAYKPIMRFSQSSIAPTEKDDYWRLQTIQGYVHDMGAAMMGGVAGHAGLFSNSKDVAVLMQMLLNKGYYGGIQYIKPETVELFTTRHPKSTRRGLGFDMKELNLSKAKSMSSLAPAATFGHTGFTGTAAWADPVNNIVYIFCTNRTYPSRHNQSFNKREYRHKIQSVIYQALDGYQRGYY
jgi:beta-glucosidase-like glycosyl hydrolase/CubicO group peptidase (beta-lactamase class C family)